MKKPISKWTMLALCVARLRAWVWYSLAEKGGEAQATEKLARLKAELSTEQLAKAERQLSAWQPGQCQQEPVQDAAGH